MSDEARSHDLLILAPTFPGDLIASRTVIVAFAMRASVLVAVRQELAPILDDLPVTVRRYSMSAVAPTDNDVSSQQFELLGIPTDLPSLDLVGSPATRAWIATRSAPSTGYALDPAEEMPYTTVVNWAIPPGKGTDRTHFAVRLLRALPEYAAATSWPEGYFERALYTPVETPIPRALALAPGCGKWGLDKRMPLEFWRQVATYARARGWMPTWFLGPDETDLAAPLVETGDTLVSGGWDIALSHHARCAVGISNDTSHLHLRAHLGRTTLVFFRRGEAPEWGYYPRFVTCIESAESLADSEAIRAAIEWLAPRDRELT